MKVQMEEAEMGLKSPSSDMTQLEVWVTLNLTCASVQ